jgi:DNA-binding CsgD family transcriptional regulator
MVDAVAGDTDAMRTHLERAVHQASDSGFAAARCESLARLAVEASRLGARSADEDLLSVAERAADEASRLAASLPGHAPWGAQSDAARAVVALARGGPEEAAAFALAAGDALQRARHEDANLDVLLPVAQVLKDTGAPEWEAAVRPSLQLTLAMIVQRTMGDDVRVRWLRGPVGALMVELAGSIDLVATQGGNGQGRSDDDRLLASLVRGKTNREIAEELGIDESAVTRRLGELFATIGVSSRADATAFAFRERVL